jgi:hypothetical protein
LATVGTGYAGNQSIFWNCDRHVYYDDHAPPHFHAIYGSEKAQFCINPLGLLKGQLSPRALALVTEWAALHQMELLDAWGRCAVGQKPPNIEPLR